MDGAKHEHEQLSISFSSSCAVCCRSEKIFFLITRVLSLRPTRDCVCFGCDVLVVIKKKRKKSFPSSAPAGCLTNSLKSSATAICDGRKKKKKNVITETETSLNLELSCSSRLISSSSSTNIFSRPIFIFYDYVLKKNV
jgi:hypothetical protein